MSKKVPFKLGIVDMPAKFLPNMYWLMFYYQVFHVGVKHFPKVAFECLSTCDFTILYKTLSGERSVAYKYQNDSPKNIRPQCLCTVASRPVLT